MEPYITVAGIIITGVFSTLVAIINSNAQRARTEQKFEDTFKVIQTRLDELSDTDSCCVILKDDVAQIKDNITTMSAAINQLKAESQTTDELLMKTNMLMLRHTINEGYRVFKEVGHIDKETKASLLSLGDIYIDGYKGNTFVDHEIEYLKDLPEV